MAHGTKITFIDDVSLAHKTILMRVDFNVSLNPNNTIADDARIQQTIPTIEYLLKRQNKLILIAHLGQPTKRNEQDSLKPVARRLHQYLPHYTIKLVKDFLTDAEAIKKQKQDEIILLENIRFYPEEETNDKAFSGKLAKLGQVYVNDAFGVAHRTHASVVGLPRLLPSYAGLLMKKEITMLEKLTHNPKKPFIAIIGGKKIRTKIAFINRLASIANYLLLGGGLANTFLLAQGHKVGKHLAIAEEDIQQAQEILKFARSKGTNIILPSDVVVGDKLTSKQSLVKKIHETNDDDELLDIGPETQAAFGAIIDRAKTIVWNGPVGYIENPVFKRGTDFLYYMITQNDDAVSVVGGGDTLAAISKKEYLDHITHISTGGGAMLEFIENGTLPGIEALKRKSH